MKSLIAASLLSSVAASSDPNDHYDTDPTSCADCSLLQGSQAHMVIKWSHRHPNMQAGFKCDWDDSSKTTCTCQCHQAGDRLQGCQIANDNVVGGSSDDCITRASCATSQAVRLKDVQNVRSLGTTYAKNDCIAECKAKSVERDTTVACMWKQSNDGNADQGNCVWSTSSTEFTRQTGAYTSQSDGSAFGERDFNHANGPTLVEPEATKVDDAGNPKKWTGIACYPAGKPAYTGTPSSNADTYLFNVQPPTGADSNNMMQDLLWDFEDGTMQGFTLTSGDCGHQPLKYVGSGDDRWSNSNGGSYFFNTYRYGTISSTVGSDPRLCIYDDKSHSFTIGSNTQIEWDYSAQSNSIALMDCSTDQELKAERLSYNNFNMQHVTWSPSDLSSLSGRCVYFRISDEGTGGWDHLQLDNLQVENALP